MIRRPPRSTQGVSSAASDVYKRQELEPQKVNVLARNNSIDHPVLSSPRAPHMTSCRRYNIKTNRFEDIPVSVPFSHNNNGNEESIRNPTLSPQGRNCLLYTSPSPRDLSTSRMPSSA
eukprot:TRINITY_DN23893_c0_g1_i3.p1 TRINITY_DN23893_c0_g1~~TRINITY_DN23893_c0_g1_i3.p1  ORF type:complete len:118 (+),score=24.74 TRINITY_DN23893_c0_g1_i3:126-479(+)